MHAVGETTRCRKCSLALTVTESMRRWGKYVCAACITRAMLAWTKRNRDKKRALNNAYHSRHSSERRAATARYRARHPLATQAHQAVQTALRSGNLKRCPCEVCGDRRTHAHHDDYLQPLQVRWLCHDHHMKHHAMLAERDKVR